MHVHRVGDLGLLAAALRPDAPDDREAMDRVAEAMMQATNDDGESCAKGELSTRITPLLPSPLRQSCPSCRAEHVPDGLFRAATLPAGLRLHPAGNRSAAFTRAPAPQPHDRDSARHELLRRFLRRCGPATLHDLAAWTGITPQAAKTWWSLLAADLAEVRVDGHRLWMHAEDLQRAHRAGPPTAVRVLPPYDPLTEVAHRQLLTPDPAHRRQVWRAVANPGVVLVAGELVGTWRRRGRMLTVTTFAPLPDRHRHAVRDQATTAGRPEPTEVTFHDGTAARAGNP